MVAGLIALSSILEPERSRRRLFYLWKRCWQGGPPRPDRCPRELRGWSGTEMGHTGSSSDRVIMFLAAARWHQPAELPLGA